MTFAWIRLWRYRPGGDPHWQPSTDPTAWNYWRREPDAYATGLVSSFADYDVTAPRCLSVIEPSDTQRSIWLDHIDGESGHEFGTKRIVDFGYRLGAAQGAWSVAGSDAPSVASREFLRDFPASKTLGWDLLDDDDAWAQPVVADGFPAALRDGANWLHENRRKLLSLLRRLPRTLSHLDVWPNNLIASGPNYVLVDWAFVGDGAMAEDIANLVPDAVFDRCARFSDLDDLASNTLTSYQRGLAESGWQGNPALVDIAFHAAAVKYDWLVPWMLAKAGEEQLDYGTAAPVDVLDRYRERGNTLLRLTEWAREAISAAHALGIPTDD